MMQPTGERFLPEMEGAYIAYEHWHRYLFATAFARGKAVLDVACGEGYGSDLLAAHADSVVGVDLDPEAVQHASAAYPRANLTFLCGPAQEIPIAGQHRFDVVVSFETLEHLQAEAQGQFLQEVKRLLKPGGLLVISTPNRLIYSERNRYQNPFHEHELSAAEFVRFLHRHFPHVRMLSQRVYPGSYIWNLDQPGRQCNEYQLALENGQLRPTQVDGKEQLYYVALCSEAALAAAPNSLMLDLDEVAVRGITRPMTTLFVDRGQGFREEDAYRLPLGDPASFQLHFRFDECESGMPRSLRWDPVEMRTCRVWLSGIRWQSPDGSVQDLDLTTVSSNGTRDGEAYCFDSFDPMLFLAVAGPVQAVTITGRCEVDDVATSMRRVQGQLEAAQTRLCEREQRLHELERSAAAAASLASVSQMLHKAQDESAALEAKARGLESQLETVVRERAEVIVRLHLAQGENAQLSRHLLGYTEERAQVLARLEAYDKERAQVVAQLEAYETERSRFLGCLCAVEQERRDSMAVVAATAAERGRLAAQVRSLEEERARLMARQRASQEERARLEGALQGIEMDTLRLDHQLRSLMTSRRWRWATSLRSAVYFLPHRVLGLGHTEQQRSA